MKKRKAEKLMSEKCDVRKTGLAIMVFDYGRGP